MMNSLSSKIIILLLLLLGVQHWTQNRRPMQGVGVVQGQFLFPRLPETFARHGDINIGMIESITESVSRHNWCGGALNYEIYPEVAAYAVELANKNHLLPNNLTLGFVLLNDCFNKRLTVAQALSFVPQTVCSVATPQASIQKPNDVVAVIGARTSGQSIDAAYILGPVKLPQVSIFSTSDELTNSKRFPYFLRVIPPDRFHYQAITELIKTHSWTYISVVYMAGSYGQNSYKQLSQLLESSDICLAVERIIHGESDEEVEDIARELVEEHERARVVVMIVLQGQARKVIMATDRLLSKGTFIWIATDAWSKYPKQWTDIRHLLWDSLLVDNIASYVPEFEDWYRQRTPNESSPWFRDRWEKHFHCSLDDGTCDDAMTASHITLPEDPFTSVRGYILDAVFMVANATSRVLRQAGCQDLTGSDARKCVTGPRLLRELKATQEYGYSGWLELDNDGDRCGFIEITQLRPVSADLSKEETVFAFSSIAGKMMHVSDVMWTSDNLRPGSKHPLSQCSFPCEPQAARITRQVSCCWVCRPCEVNQRLVNDGRNCEHCPNLTWPDPDTAYTTCSPISLSTVRLDSPTGIVTIILTLLGLLVCLAVSLYFYHHRHCPLIVSSGRSLSFLMLFFIATGYGSVIIFHLPPSRIICRLKFLLLCTSIASLFGSLFARTQYVFRKNQRDDSESAPKCVSGRQLGLSLSLLSVQAVMSSLVVKAYPEWSLLTVRDNHVPFVEHTCLMPHVGLLSLILYNGLLVILIAVLAFRTSDRDLTFNENHFTFLCTCAMLIISLCFIPAYLVARREVHRTLILVMTLWLSHSIVLVFHFLTKVYTVWYGRGHISSS